MRPERQLAGACLLFVSFLILGAQVFGPEVTVGVAAADLGFVGIWLVLPRRGR